MPIESVDECKASAGFFKEHYPEYEYQGYWPWIKEDYPEGCYIEVSESKYGNRKGINYDGFFNPPSNIFNADESGAGDSYSRALCKKTGGFIRISTGDCASKGLRMITNAATCEAAATALNLSDMFVPSSIDRYRPSSIDRPYDHMIDRYSRIPYGCIYASNGQLSYRLLNGHQYENFPCGTIEGNYHYDCICQKYGCILNTDCPVGEICQNGECGCDDVQDLSDCERWKTDGDCKNKLKDWMKDNYFKTWGYCNE